MKGRKSWYITINKIRFRGPLEIQTIQPKKYLQQTTEFEYNGYKLPILITYNVIRHTQTHWELVLPMFILIHISRDCWYALLLTMAVTILLGKSWNSANEAVSRFAGYHIDMVSCVHRKCSLELVYQSINFISSTRAYGDQLWKYKLHELN